VGERDLYGGRHLRSAETVDGRKDKEMTVPCDDQIRVLHLENQQLRAARDLLLPRLNERRDRLVDLGKSLDGGLSQQ